MALRPISQLTDDEVEELFLGMEAADPSQAVLEDTPLDRLIANLRAHRGSGHFLIRSAAGQ